jgi:hypothetical protein
MSPTEPERFGSSEQEHFKEAYQGRPVLMGITGVLFLSVFLWAVGGVVALVSGEFRYGIGSLVLSGVSFVCWSALHNWALMHPK